jgi:RNA polymerase sporulation-specific sigma factor
MTTVRTQEDVTEADLIYASRAGDNAAFELLLRRHDQLVRIRARAFFLQGAEYEDLVQEGMIGLFKAVRDFREDAGSFRAFADLCITRQIITAVKTASRQKHVPLNSAHSLDAPRYDEQDGRTLGDSISSTTPPPDMGWLQSHEVKTILDVLRLHLSPFEYRALVLWLEGRRYDEIGRRLDRHTKSVDNGLWRVKCKIRRLLRAGALPV